jgi:hypothetical protein
MTDNNMDQLIVDLVTSRPRISFVELSKRIPNFSGDGIQLISGAARNVIFWHNLTKQSHAAIVRLTHEKKIYMHPAEIITYAMDGMTLLLPIAKQARDYKKPHWLPVVFCTWPYTPPSKSNLPRVKIADGK